MQLYLILINFIGILKMKIISKFVSAARNYVNHPYVSIAKYYTRSAADDALYQLEPVKDVFESYAKHEGVFLDIDKASKLMDGAEIMPTTLKNLLNNSIALKVHNALTGKEKISIIDVTKDTFNASIPHKVTISKNNGELSTIETSFNCEDNLIRAVYRTFETLVKKVQK